MSFIYCTNKKCGWSQDDFWSPEGYNPTIEGLKNQSLKM